MGKTYKDNKKLSKEERAAAIRKNLRKQFSSNKRNEKSE